MDSTISITVLTVRFDKTLIDVVSRHIKIKMIYK